MCLKRPVINPKDSNTSITSTVPTCFTNCAKFNKLDFLLYTFSVILTSPLKIPILLVVNKKMLYLMEESVRCQKGPSSKYVPSTKCGCDSVLSQIILQLGLCRLHSFLAARQKHLPHNFLSGFLHFTVLSNESKSALDLVNNTQK